MKKLALSKYKYFKTQEYFVQVPLEQWVSQMELDI
jgi:hypothetical protein